MILSASRRTDIPCYYSEWFMNRIRVGFVLVRNPMNRSQLSQITLTPDVVDCIVFWTKDAAPMLPHLHTLEEMGYPFYFQFTLTPYGKELEKNLRDKSDIVDTYIGLSQMIGKERILWRYDPIVLNEDLSVDYHKDRFLRLCDKLHPYTESVTISFVDRYAKLKTNLIREITEGEIAELSVFIGQTAREYGLNVMACCEKTDLMPFGIGRASCIDKAVLERICGCPLDLSADKDQREGCGCMESVDIGAYNSCPNGCVYCYANLNPDLAMREYRSHDLEAALLIGSVAEGEKISVRDVRSNKRRQMSFLPEDHTRE